MLFQLGNLCASSTPCTIRVPHAQKSGEGEGGGALIPFVYHYLKISATLDVGGVDWSLVIEAIPQDWGVVFILFFLCLERMRAAAVKSHQNRPHIQKVMSSHLQGPLRTMPTVVDLQGLLTCAQSLRTWSTEDPE